MTSSSPSAAAFRGGGQQPPLRRAASDRRPRPRIDPAPHPRGGQGSLRHRLAEPAHVGLTPDRRRQLPSPVPEVMGKRARMRGPVVVLLRAVGLPHGERASRSVSRSQQLVWPRARRLSSTRSRQPSSARSAPGRRCRRHTTAAATPGAPGRREPTAPKARAAPTHRRCRRRGRRLAVVGAPGDRGRPPVTAAPTAPATTRPARQDDGEHRADQAQREHGDHEGARTRSSGAEDERAPGRRFRLRPRLARSGAGRRAGQGQSRARPPARARTRPRGGRMAQGVDGARRHRSRPGRWRCRRHAAGSEVRRSPSISALAPEDGIAVQHDHVAVDDALRSATRPSTSERRRPPPSPATITVPRTGHDVVVDLAPRAPPPARSTSTVVGFAVVFDQVAPRPPRARPPAARNGTHPPSEQRRECSLCSLSVS